MPWLGRSGFGHLGFERRRGVREHRFAPGRPGPRRSAAGRCGATRSPVGGARPCFGGGDGGLGAVGPRALEDEFGLRSLGGFAHGGFVPLRRLAHGGFGGIERCLQLGFGGGAHGDLGVEFGDAALERALFVGGGLHLRTERPGRCLLRCCLRERRRDLVPSGREVAAEARPFLFRCFQPLSDDGGLLLSGADLLVVGGGRLAFGGLGLRADRLRFRASSMELCPHGPDLDADRFGLLFGGLGGGASRLDLRTGGLGLAAGPVRLLTGEADLLPRLLGLEP